MSNETTPTYFGSISVVELTNRLSTLQAAAASTRREEAGALAKQAAEFVKVASKELAADERARDEAEASYSASFSLAQRMTAWVGFGGRTQEKRSASVLPVRAEVKGDRDVLQTARLLHASLAQESQRVESRNSYKSGIASVYNPVTGRVEWHSSYKSGVAGVYNPATGQVEWNSGYKSGVAGVYNPATARVEWNKSYMSGVAGVFNPETNRIEWNESYKSGVAGVFNPVTRQVEWLNSYKSGVAGVWNPLEQRVEWKTSYKSGIVGFFDPVAQKAVFVDSYKSGVSVVYFDGQTYRTVSSDYGALAEVIEEDDG